MTDAGVNWTDERVELLKKLWSDGLSASQIAAELGNVTRNAVIGKVHRLGLSGRAKDVRQPHGPASSARPLARRAHRRPSPPQSRTTTSCMRASSTRPLCRRRSRMLSGDDDVAIPMSGARDDHGAARIHVPLAHGRSDEAGIPLLRGPLRSPALPYCIIMPASPTSRSPIASVSGSSLAAEPRRMPQPPDDSRGACSRCQLAAAPF